MIDFTLKKYTDLLRQFIDSHYRFVTFEYYCSHRLNWKRSVSSFYAMTWI